MAKSVISVKPDKSRLVNLLEDIEKGEIKIPIFQRTLVWSEAQMKELFDSIVKGYPIGSLLLWMPKDKYKCYTSFGPFELYDDSIGQPQYILDGCQRLSTLFGALTNPQKHPITKNVPLKKFSIFYNLRTGEFTYLKGSKNQAHLIPLYKIVDTYEYLDFLKKIQEEVKDESEKEKLINNLKKISKIFIDYEIPYTIIYGGDINSAVEIFSRVNSTGVDISEDWMLSALLYNNESDFLLSDSITAFCNKMKKYNFENIKRDTILDCIASTSDINRVYFDIKVEDLAKRDKKEFELITTQTFENLEKAIHFLYSSLCVVDYRLLPYPSQLIFITEFFRINPFPDDFQRTQLKQWFWVTSYSNYFTIYSLSQQRKAYEVFKDFALGKHPTGLYYFETAYTELFDTLPFKTQPFPLEINFGSVRSKALQLFILNEIGISPDPKFENENIVDQYFAEEYGKAVGNVLLRFNSDLFENAHLKNIEALLQSDEDLERYFINATLIRLHNQDDFFDFIETRRDLIKDREKDFLTFIGFDFEDDFPESF